VNIDKYQPMHLRLKKGMLIGIKINQKMTTALVVSDVYAVSNMQFNIIDIISQGQKRKFRTSWVKEIYCELG
jgi:hypothetical protein